MADELRRELEALGAAAAGAEHPGRHSVDGREAEGRANGTGWRMDHEVRPARALSAPSSDPYLTLLLLQYRRHSSRSATDERPPSARAHPDGLQSKFSSNSSAPQRYRSSPHYHRPTLSSVAQSLVRPFFLAAHSAVEHGAEASPSRAGQSRLSARAAVLERAGLGRPRRRR